MTPPTITGGTLVLTTSNHFHISPGGDAGPGPGISPVRAALPRYIGTPDTGVSCGAGVAIGVALPGAKMAGLWRSPPERRLIRSEATSTIATIAAACSLAGN